MNRPLRVALLGGAAATDAATLARGLHRAGQLPTLLTPDPATAPPGTEVVRLRSVANAPLHVRRIGDGLGYLPHAWIALARGRFDLAHGFEPAGALPAVAWARRSQRPVVLTFAEPLDRATIANGRLRLATLERALHGADAVLASSDEVRRSLRRLLALEVRVVDPSDAAAHVALYRELSSLPRR